MWRDFWVSVSERARLAPLHLHVEEVGTQRAEQSLDLGKIDVTTLAGGAGLPQGRKQWDQSMDGRAWIAEAEIECADWVFVLLSY